MLAVLVALAPTSDWDRQSSSRARVFRFAGVPACRHPHAVTMWEWRGIPVLLYNPQARSAAHAATSSSWTMSGGIWQCIYTRLCIWPYIMYKSMHTQVYAHAHVWTHASVYVILVYFPLHSSYLFFSSLINPILPSPALPSLRPASPAQPTPETNKYYSACPCPCSTSSSLFS